MYIAMQCSDSNGTLNTEVCTFYGIRYDTRYRSAVISTEHLNHDYVVPMDPKDYENAVKQIMEAMKERVELINIEQGIVCRGRKGESRHVEPQRLVIKPV
ncbi:hypothetical protein D6853_09985 [Butyrivibrio sp. X503]|uniref:hypothetical protein n=1 Tax=unclassified Butyrivibrio TaxID=2639466 RepID=UPI000EA98553|nr:MULTISPECIES: hypothetical protein [unclassified Butyrivibrio]RKM55866.1 hypothetical protein D6853_09985 [Butyrivibrio sp. X503]RKM63148.1 hypothetical protein D6856_03220 [Butyrivibrio sp. XB500-5]